MNKFVFLVFGFLFINSGYSQNYQPVLRLNTPMHSSRINGVCSDKLGKRVLTFSDDKTAKIWDANTGDLIRTLRVPWQSMMGGIVFRGALSPDGELAVLYVISTTNKVYIFKVSTGEVVQVLEGLVGKISDIKFTSNGERVAISSTMGGVTIFDRQKDGLYAKYRVLWNGPVERIAFAGNGNLVIGLLGGIVKLYNSSLSEIAKVKGGGNTILSIDYSSDGEKIAVGYLDKKLIEVFSGENLTKLYEPKLKKVTKAGALSQVAFSNDGRYLYAAGSQRVGMDHGMGVTSHKHTFAIYKYDKGGLGKVEIYKVADNTFTYLASIGNGDILFSTGVPEWGRLSSLGETRIYKQGDTYHFNRTRDFGGLFKLNNYGDLMSIWPIASKIINFSFREGIVKNTSRFMKEGELENYHVKSKGTKITNWLNTSQPLLNGKPLQSIQAGGETTRAVDVSDDGELVLVGTNKNLNLFNKLGQIVWKKPAPGEVWFVNINEASKTVAAAFHDGIIRWYQIDGTRNLFYVQRVIPNSLAEKSGLKVGDLIESVNDMTFSSMQDLQFNIKDPKKYKFQILRNNRPKTIVMDKSDELFGFQYMLIAEKGAHLLSLYVNPQNQNWILWTPDGYFDCSSGAESYIGWHLNQGENKEALFYPSEQFYENYFTPGLGHKVLARDDSYKKRQAEEFLLPPTVKITNPANQFSTAMKNIQIEVSAMDEGGGVNEIRLYLNGKLISSNQRGFKKVGGNETFDVILTPGQNYIKAVALNDQRTESIPDEILINYEGASKKSNLHMLVVGANEYKNPKYNLNYAKADAGAFKSTLESNANSIFNTVNVIEINDKDFTRENVLNTFKQLQESTTGEDVFVFYYAGHGVMSEEDKPQFYIVPHDVTQLYGNNDLLKTNAISATELQEFSKLLPAQKQLFVLDACQSGGMTEMLAMRGAAEEKAIAQLARSTGTYWLTASGSEQFATEFAQLGHGVFTYAILEGFKGNADGGTKDKKITVKELSAFLNDYVPEISEQYKGQAQYPTSYGFGQDFPIILIK